MVYGIWLFNPSHLRRRRQYDSCVHVCGYRCFRGVLCHGSIHLQLRGALGMQLSASLSAAEKRYRGSLGMLHYIAGKRLACVCCQAQPHALDPPSARPIYRSCNWTRIAGNSSCGGRSITPTPPQRSCGRPKPWPGKKTCWPPPGTTCGCGRSCRGTVRRRRLRPWAYSIMWVGRRRRRRRQLIERAVGILKLLVERGWGEGCDL